MSTASTLLLCAGAASSLASVWTLAGFSESSAVRFSPRVAGAAAVGVVPQLSVYARASAAVQSELSLAMLFGLASVAALVVGAAKVEGALHEKDGARVVRRASGIVLGTFFGMAALGAAALDLREISLAHARVAWLLMFGLLASTWLVFALRARYAGVAAMGLGGRVVLLPLVALSLLIGARFAGASVRTLAPPSVAASAAAPPPVDPNATVAPTFAQPPAGAAPAASVDVSASGAAAIASAPPSPSSSAGPASGQPTTPPGELQIESITSRGLLEADVRGGVSRRMDRLQACLADPKNQKSGVLTLKVRVDGAGSVTYSRAIGGDLVDTPLAACLVAAFYKMGFATPASEGARFEISLRAPPP